MKVERETEKSGKKKGCREWGIEREKTERRGEPEREIERGNSLDSHGS